jgi:transglutaminase-like putative cysteine protease
MTTNARILQQPRVHLQRWRAWWSHFFKSGDWLVLLLLTLLVFQAIFSLSASEWPLAERVVVPVMLLGMGFSYMLARSQYGEFLALFINTIYGGIFTLIVAAFYENTNIIEGMASVIIRTIRWFVDAFTGGINQDPLVFTLLVAILFWFIAYNAVWHVFRIDRVWRVIIPPSLIMLANMLFYTGDAPLDTYFIAFVFISLLLFVRSHLDQREWSWYIQQVRVPRSFRWQFLSAGALLALVALLIAGAIPTNDLQERLDRFQEFLNNDPARQLAETWNRLVQPIDAEGVATADYYGGDSLNLGGAINLGDQVVMLVSVPNDRRYYWRSRVFERYSDGRWSPSATLRVPDFEAPLQIVTDNEVLGGARITVEQTITIGSSPSRLIYGAPQTVEVSEIGRIDLSYTREDVVPQPMNVSVIRPAQVLDTGESYRAISMMSVATADQLRQAGINYPEWVVNPNTYLSASVSPRVVQLARDITAQAGATNPYDTAKAIETWLRANIAYNEKIPTPPAGADPLEWFIFEISEGYCTYYASAMVNMLRSLGIPARMAAGFSQGEWDATTRQFIVRERDAHTWVEVYFPGYGWVEFEPTSAEAPLDREGDDQQQPQSLMPTPTPMPTNTPTPMPSPTPLPSSTPEGDQGQPPVLPPTITLTPSPTPTATPIIVPTIAPPIQQSPPPDGGFLSFILPALAVALTIVIVAVILVLIAFLIYWWWEWRGMRGYSPVVRAFARLERYIPLIGIRTRDQQTPEEKRGVIISKLPQAERPITAITRMYTTERYSQHGADSPLGERHAEIAEEAWTTTRRQILRRWLRRFNPFVRGDK